MKKYPTISVGSLKDDTNRHAVKRKITGKLLKLINMEENVLERRRSSKKLNDVIINIPTPKSNLEQTSGFLIITNDCKTGITQNASTFERALTTQNVTATMNKADEWDEIIKPREPRIDTIQLTEPEAKDEFLLE